MVTSELNEDNGPQFNKELPKSKQEAEEELGNLELWLKQIEKDLKKLRTKSRQRKLTESETEHQKKLSVRYSKGHGRLKVVRNYIHRNP